MYPWLIVRYNAGFVS
uniref:Uncharacterized protein n=1 Tax=Lepeophtheirus salmonis TaxID=72036 RepID=A0A0K2SZY9_LEPSM